MYQRKLQGWLKHWDFLLLDLLCLQVAYIAAYWLRMGDGVFVYAVPIYRILGIVITMADILTAAVFGTFKDVLRRDKVREIWPTVKHIIILTGLVTLFMFSVQRSEDISRLVVYITMGIHLLLSYAVRVTYRHFCRTRMLHEKRWLIITNTENANDFATRLVNDPVLQKGGRFTGMIIADAGVLHEQSVAGVPVIGGEREFLPYIGQEWIDEIFLLLPGVHRYRNTIMRQISETGIPVHLFLDRTLTVGNACEVEQIADQAAVTVSVASASVGQLVLKRMLDILGGLVGSVFAAIACVTVGPIIVRKSPGPVLFKQDRIGLNGKRFKMLKIRSMYMDAEDRKKELLAKNRIESGMMFKLDWDPRIIGNEELPDGTRKTGIGEFIRKTSIDELPQFINILKGEMSLVGTRPPTVDEWERYELHHRARLATKPGLTGLWQVSGRSQITDFEEVVRLDMEYIMHWNLWMDLKILGKTFMAVIRRKGAM